MPTLPDQERTPERLGRKSPSLRRCLLLVCQGIYRPKAP